MTNPTEIIPGVIFYSYLAAVKTDKVGFMENDTLVLLVSGQLKLETADQTISMNAGEVMLIRKHQLGQLTKIPLPGEDYQSIVISLKEEFIRQIALEEHIEVDRKYTGLPNLIIPRNEFLHAFFQSVLPYVRQSESKMANALGILKVKEAVYLLLNTMPELKEFLFDFSEPHKIDLQKFLLSNFHYNVPVEQFAKLTGRSLAGFKRDFQKIFGMAPRQWLQEKRLTEARHLIEHKHKKASAIYLDLGFESLSHFSHSFKKKYGKAPTEWAS